MQNITILGATGSIGDSTLAVLDLHPDKFQIFALSANTNWQKMLMREGCETTNFVYVALVIAS